METVRDFLFLSSKITADGDCSHEIKRPLLLCSPDVKIWLICKDPDAGKDWGQEKKGMTVDEMVG